MSRRLVSRDGTLFGDPDDMGGAILLSFLQELIENKNRPCTDGWDGMEGWMVLQGPDLMTFFWTAACDRITSGAYMRV